MVHGVHRILLSSSIFIVPRRSPGSAVNHREIASKSSHVNGRINGRREHRSRMILVFTKIHFHPVRQMVWPFFKNILTKYRKPFGFVSWQNFRRRTLALWHGGSMTGMRSTRFITMTLRSVRNNALKSKRFEASTYKLWSSLESKLNHSPNSLS